MANFWAPVLEYIECIEEYIAELNYLEYEYSLLIGEACEKLSKYIFTEELEDFFYAKKTTLEQSEDLATSYREVKMLRERLNALRKKTFSQCGCSNQNFVKEILSQFF